MDIPKDVQEKIIFLFCNTNTKISNILEVVNKKMDMSIEQLYDFLYNYMTENGEKLVRNGKSISPKIKNKVFELRKKGLPYYKISQSLSISGIKLGPNKVKEICKIVFAENDVEDPWLDDNKRRILVRLSDGIIDRLKSQGYNQKQIKEYFIKFGVDLSDPYKTYQNTEQNLYKISNNYLTEYIYELRKDGCSYNIIAERLYEEGIKISYESIRKISKNVFKEHNEIEAKAKYQKKNQISLLNEEIYELRKQGLTYLEISQFLETKDIHISYETIRQYCKKIFKDKNEEEAKSKHTYDLDKDDINQEIYNLRKQGLSYNAIKDELEKRGIAIKKWTVAYRCQKIFEQKNESNDFSEQRKQVSKSTDETIYSLRKQGYSDIFIVDYLRQNGIQIGRKNVYRRMANVFKEKGEEIPKPSIRKKREICNNTLKNKSEKELLNMIIAIGEKKKANQYQLKRFAKEVSKLYGKDINLNVAYNDEHDKEER